MLKAIELVKQGKSAYQAARETGVTAQGIYKSRQYKEWKALQGEKK